MTNLDQLGPEQLASVVVAELVQARDFYRKAANATPDDEIREAFQLAAETHERLLTDLEDAGVDPRQVDPAIAAPIEQDYRAIERELAEKSAPAVGHALSEHEHVLLESLEQLFDQTPVTAVQHAIKDNYQRVQRIEQIMHKLEQRAA